MTIVTEAADWADDRGNRITGRADCIGTLRIVFEATGCTVDFAPGARLTGATLVLCGPEARITLGAAAHFKGSIHAGAGCEVSLGARLTVTGDCRITTAEGAGVSIGADCMFATGVRIRSDDAHPICDAATGQRLNPSRPVTIGDRVWLADEAVVLAGATIGEGAVIGMRALVKGTIPAACAAAGIPARVIRHGIRWDRTQLRQLSAPERAPA